MAWNHEKESGQDKMRFIFVRFVAKPSHFCSHLGVIVEPGMKGGDDNFSRSLVLGSHKVDPVGMFQDSNFRYYHFNCMVKIPHLLIEL